MVVTEQWLFFEQTLFNTNTLLLFSDIKKKNSRVLNQFAHYSLGHVTMFHAIHINWTQKNKTTFALLETHMNRHFLITYLRSSTLRNMLFFQRSRMRNVLIHGNYQIWFFLRIWDSLCRIFAHEHRISHHQNCQLRHHSMHDWIIFLICFLVNVLYHKHPCDHWKPINKKAVISFLYHAYTHSGFYFHVKTIHCKMLMIVNI